MLGLELFENSNRLLERARHNRRLARVGIASTPHDVIHAENKLRVLRYRTETPVSQRLPVLIVPSLINRHYILDLLPGKSLTESLSQAGFDVATIDWGAPGDEDRLVSFDRYTDSYLHHAVRAVARAAGTEQVILLGYCLGGTMSGIYASLHPETVAGLVALTAPVNFHNSGLLSAWCRAKTYNIDNLVEAYGNVPWALMQTSFHMLRPTTSLNRALGLVKRIWDDAFLDSFYALEMWGNDNVSFPGECYRTFIQSLYRDNALVKGSMEINGRAVDLRRITCPVLNVSAEHDHIVPVDATMAWRDLVGSRRYESWTLPGGHIGAIISRRASEAFWPRLADWLEAAIGERMRINQVITPAERSARHMPAETPGATL